MATDCHLMLDGANVWVLCDDTAVVAIQIACSGYAQGKVIQRASFVVALLICSISLMVTWWYC